MGYKEVVLFVTKYVLHKGLLASIYLRRFAFIALMLWRSLYLNCFIRFTLQLVCICVKNTFQVNGSTLNVFSLKRRIYMSYSKNIGLIDEKASQIKWQHIFRIKSMLFSEILCAYKNCKTQWCNCWKMLKGTISKTIYSKHNSFKGYQIITGIVNWTWFLCVCIIDKMVKIIVC